MEVRKKCGLYKLFEMFLDNEFSSTVSLAVIVVAVVGVLMVVAVTFIPCDI